MVLNVNLNIPEDRVPQNNGMGQTLSLGLPSHENVDNDDVMIISARAFAEAVESSRRRQRAEVIHDNTPTLPLNSASGLTIGPLPSTTLGEAGSMSHEEITQPGRPRRTRLQQKGSNQAGPFMPVQAPSNPPQPISTWQETVLHPQLTCPICISPFDEATTTKCGHLFCRECIQNAIRVQKKCPTCRRKMRIRDTLRVYISN